VKLERHNGLVLADRVLAELTKLPDLGHTIDVRAFANGREQGYRLTITAARSLHATITNDRHNDDLVVLTYARDRAATGHPTHWPEPIHLQPGDYFGAARVIWHFLAFGFTEEQPKHRPGLRTAMRRRRRQQRPILRLVRP
jgi:hypothetical protein